MSRIKAQDVLDLLKQLGGKGTIRDLKSVSSFTTAQIHNAIYARLEPIGCVVAAGQTRAASGNMMTRWAFVKDWAGSKAKKEPTRACQKTEVAPGHTIVRHGRGYASPGGQGRK